MWKGKSSILDCLAILLSQFTGRIQTSPDSIRSLSEQDITQGSRETHNEIQVVIESRELTWSLTQSREQDPLSAYRDRISSSVEKLNAKIKQIRPGGEINPFAAFAEQIEQFALSTIAGGDMSEEVAEVLEKLRTQVEASNDANLPLAVHYPVNRAVLDIPLEKTDEGIITYYFIYEGIFIP